MKHGWKLSVINTRVIVVAYAQSFLIKCVLNIEWRGTGWREPGRIGAGGGREAGGNGAGCGSHVRAGGGRRMRDIKFFNDFLVPF